MEKQSKIMEHPEFSSDHNNEGHPGSNTSIVKNQKIQCKSRTALFVFHQSMLICLDCFCVIMLMMQFIS